MTTSAEFCRDRHMQQLRCDESETPLIVFYMPLLPWFLSVCVISLLSQGFWGWEEHPLFFGASLCILHKIKKQGREGLGHQSLPKVHEVLCPFVAVLVSNALKDVSDGDLCWMPSFFDLHLLLGGQRRGVCDSVPVPRVVPHQTPFLGHQGTKGFYLPRIC